MHTLKVGDVAVHPAHGVAEVMGIESREISGGRVTFYILKVLETGIKIFLSTEKVEQSGVRAVIDEREASEIYDILKGRDSAIDSETWPRHQGEVVAKVRAGAARDLAAAMRDTRQLKVDRDLSFTERKLMRTARSILVRELSIAKKTDVRAVEQELSRLLDS